MPENTTLILESCRIKLSDACRDNFIRSANCGMGIEDPLPIKNIHIKGVGREDGMRNVKITNVFTAE